MHLLKTTPEVYERWLATPKDDAPAICPLIGRTMGLAQAPTALDLETMAKYADVALTEETRDLIELDERTPRHVGVVALMHHREDLRELLESDDHVPRHVGLIGMMQQA